MPLLAVRILAFFAKQLICVRGFVLLRVHFIERYRIRDGIILDDDRNSFRRRIFIHNHYHFGYPIQFTITLLVISANGSYLHWRINDERLTYFLFLISSPSTNGIFRSTRDISFCLFRSSLSTTSNCNGC